MTQAARFIAVYWCNYSLSMLVYEKGIRSGTRPYAVDLFCVATELLCREAYRERIRVETSSNICTLPQQPTLRPCLPEETKVLILHPSLHIICSFLQLYWLW